MMTRTMMRMMTTTITGTRPILRRGYQSHKIHATHSACSPTTIMTMTWRLKKAIVSSLRPSSPRIFTTLFARPHPHQRPTWLPPTLKNAKVQSFRDAVPDHLHDFEDVFNKESFDSLPERCKWHHAFELEREPSPGFRKVYPMTLEEQAELDAFLEEALATGRIRPSKSPIGAPVFFVKKKDGKLRFVQDYRALNAITRK